MLDSGVLSYPRYKLELPSISVTDKHRSFAFGGLPSEEMSLQLYIAGLTVDNFWRVA